MKKTKKKTAKKTQKKTAKKTENKMGIYSCEGGDNSDLIKKVSKMYLKPGYTVADVTYGKGVFWRKVDVGQFSFFPSDIKTCPKSPHDFRSLPYDDESFDVVVFDPPYTDNPGNMISDANYLNRATTKGMYHKDIIQLYNDGMIEAYRILKTGGTMWVKCKDEIESSYQRWSHLEIYDIALKIGLFGKDFFVFVQRNKPVIQHKNQKHARKNHSYLWVFKKPLSKETKELKRFGII